LGWIADGHAGSGFTSTGKARASQLAEGQPVSAETILRMYSFFSRHEVDKEAKGFNSGEDGFPSPGRVAWSAWGGDSGFSWSTKIRNQISERSIVLDLEEGQQMTEERNMVYGENAYGISNSVMAADASIDAAQTLLEQIMATEPIAAQAYYLLVAADAALDPVIDSLGLSDPDEEANEDENNQEMESKIASIIADPDDDPDPNEDLRAAAARLGEGTFVSWNTSNGRARGKIIKVITKGQAKSSEGFTIEATPDQPAYQVRIYKEQGNGYIPTDVVTVHRGDYLTVTSALAAPRSEDLSMIEERKSAIATAEKITMATELRSIATDDGSLRIGGYAATFNVEADGLNFREVIAPGAFTRTLQTDNPVFLLVNHDTEQLPLASTQSGTLRLSQDEHGLRMEADLDPANPRAAELASALSRGDVDKMSFAFTVAPDGDMKEDGLRTLKDLNLFEISAVTWPAYSSTSIGMRSAEQEANDLVLRARMAKAKLTNLRLRK
jgi:HK97 family phage prohead protease